MLLICVVYVDGGSMLLIICILDIENSYMFF